MVPFGVGPKLSIFPQIEDEYDDMPAVNPERDRCDREAREKEAWVMEGGGGVGDGGWGGAVWGWNGD